MSRHKPPRDDAPALDADAQQPAQVFEAPVETDPEVLGAARSAQRAERDALRAIRSHSAAQTRHRTLSWRWFTTARPLNVSPLVLTGTAALLLLTTAIAIRSVERAENAVAEAPLVPAAGDAQIVRFSLEAAGAQTVSLVGDFNGWDPAATEMLGRGGTWTVVIPVAPGRHQYGFVINGSTFLPDPAAARAADADFGSTNSVLYVGG